jgi:hypothetical protein
MADNVEDILRCDDCGKLNHRLYLRKRGSCYHCGNRRYKTVQQLSAEEWVSIRDKTYKFGLKQWPATASKFVELFEPVEDV